MKINNNLNFKGLRITDLDTYRDIKKLYKNKEEKEAADIILGAINMCVEEKDIFLKSEKQGKDQTVFYFDDGVNTSNGIAVSFALDSPWRYRYERICAILGDFHQAAQKLGWK